VKLIAIALIIGGFGVAARPTADQDLERTIISGGAARSYRVFVPESASQSGPAPAVVLFNGSGSPVQPLLEFWKTVARKDGVVLIGPAPFAPGAWRIPEDSPEFSHDVVEAVKAAFAIDPRRVYLFGQSGGGGHALSVALLESEYYAAAAEHANALPGSAYPFMNLAKRKIPLGLWVGTNDQLVPLSAVRDTYNALVTHGFTVERYEIKDHSHAYAERGDELTAEAWAFLKKQHLDHDPVYQAYRTSK
jgi:poly(3-hydroxybutyrate) depolymerase